MTKNPCRLLRLPKWWSTRTVRSLSNETSFDRLIAAAAESTRTDYARVLIMGICGLRVSEACSLDVESSLLMKQGHRMFRGVQKGGDTAMVPQPPLVMQAVDRVIARRETGALLRRRDGSRMTRSSADRVIQRLARNAHIETKVSPHVLRHTPAITCDE